MIQEDGRAFRQKLKAGLVDIRFQAKLSQAQIAARMETSKKTIQSWESPSGASPDIESVYEYVRACDQIPSVFIQKLFDPTTNAATSDNQDEVDERLSYIINDCMDVNQKKKLLYLLSGESEIDFRILLEMFIAFSKLDIKEQTIMLSTLVGQAEFVPVSASDEYDIDLGILSRALVAFKTAIFSEKKRIGLALDFSDNRQAEEPQNQNGFNSKDVADFFKE